MNGPKVEGISLLFAKELKSCCLNKTRPNAGNPEYSAVLKYGKMNLC